MVDSVKGSEHQQDGDFDELQPEKTMDWREWSNVISVHFPHVVITTDREHEFRAGQREAELEGIQFFDMSTDAHSVVQPDVLELGAEIPLCKLSLQLDGMTRLCQDGRSCTLVPGDLALYVTHRPYQLQYDGAQRSIIIQFPQEFLHLIHDQVSMLTATPISRDEGLGRVAVPLFAELARNVQILEGSSGFRLIRSSLEMLVTVLLEVSKEQGRDTSENSIFHQVVAYIEDHLWDPELGPQKIADYFYVSLRQLHSRFADQGLTVSSYIRDQRIRRIRDDLADPAYASETVQTISSRYGLTDASYVSKLFKQTFDETPSGYRARLQGSS